MFGDIYKPPWLHTYKDKIFINLKSSNLIGQFITSIIETLILSLSVLSWKSKLEKLPKQLLVCLVKCQLMFSLWQWHHTHTQTEITFSCIFYCLFTEYHHYYYHKVLYTILYLAASPLVLSVYNVITDSVHHTNTMLSL